MRTYRLTARSLVLRFLLHAALYAVGVITLYPFVWMVFTSLKSPMEMFRNKWLWPTLPVITNYLQILKGSHIELYFLNSVILAVISVPLMIAVGALAGYSIARYRFRFTRPAYYFFVGAQMMPFQIVPLFLLMRYAHLLNTRTGIIIVYVSLAVPFVAFLLQGFFRTLPAELEDAARVDGCSEPRIFFQVMLPLARAGLLTAAIFQFTYVWNDFLLALVLLQRQSLKTLNVGLFALMGQFSVDIPIFFAGLTISLIPVVAVYISFTKQFVSGITVGAVKG